MSYTLHHGDCLDVMRGMPDASVDAVVTDPPYGMKWDTVTTRFSGGHNPRRRGAGRNDDRPIQGDDSSFDPSPWLHYPKVILFGANHFAARLPVGTTLVWVKRNEAAYGSFLSDAEVAWMKGGHGVYLHKDLSMNGMARRRVHPTQKPVGLMRWCIERLNLKPGSTIFDPYMGGGSTGVAALDLGHNFIGIERDPGYHAIATKRLAEAENALPLLVGSA